jgi:hypothetical protein
MQGSLGPNHLIPWPSFRLVVKRTRNQTVEKQKMIGSTHYSHSIAPGMTDTLEGTLKNPGRRRHLVAPGMATYRNHVNGGI